MEILKLDPAIKDYLWGGRKLVEKFNKVSDLDKVAETWEMSNHKDGSSIVINGEYKGLSFSEYLMIVLSNLMCLEDQILLSILYFHFQQ